MVGMLVARQHEIDALELVPSDRSAGHTDMGARRRLVFLGEVLRKIEIDGEQPRSGLDQETTLAEPPDDERPGNRRRCGDFGDQVGVLTSWLNHRGRIQINTSRVVILVSVNSVAQKRSICPTTYFCGSRHG